MLLILASYRLSGFAVQAGGPRMFGFYADLTAILAVTLLADGHSAALLPLGGAGAKFDGQRGENGGAESDPDAVQQAFDIQRVVEKDAERADGQVAVLVGDPGNEHLADRHHDETK